MSVKIGLLLLIAVPASYGLTPAGIQVFLQGNPERPPASLDGNAKIDPNSGKGANPLEQVPVVGSQFDVNPVSTAMKCVINLTIQYMIVYTALAVCRTAADSWGLNYDKLPIQKILQTACTTVFYAPMLAVLFLGCRMRVLWLTQGRGNPPEWIQMCMYMCTYALLFMTLCVCIIPLFTGEVIGVDPKTGDIAQDTKPFKSPILSGLFTLLKYIIMLFLYVGVVCIIYGIITYEPPKGSWPGGEIPPVSPAVQCVMILSCQFFCVYAGVQFARSFTQLTGAKMTKFENAMSTATNAMNFAPMLAVLFLGARMRALQMDPVHGHPQRWAQNCFFMCTYAVLAQTLVSIAVPLVLQGEAKKGKTEGDMEYTVENPALGTALIVARYIIMLCIYIGFSCVVYSVLTIEHPKGPQYTPPISVTMQCVINLTFQFFFVYLGIWACVTLKELTQVEWRLVTQTMESMKATTMFCPMLSILFVGTRMRALQITQNRGAPQGWVQDGMYMATWALLIQFLMCAIIPCCTGSPAEINEDGNAVMEKKDGPAHKVAFWIVTAIKWIGFIFLYGGIITVIVGVYQMTPETANGRGSIPLVGDGKVPGTEAGVPGYDGIDEPIGPGNAGEQIPEIGHVPQPADR